MLESIYETCLIKELTIRGFHSESQVILSVYYNGEKLDKNFNIDLIVENEVIVELKTVEKILPIHKAHAMTYLKLSGKKLGVMINFNVPLLVQGFKGFKRVLNGQFPK